ncbi:MAG: acetoacetate decarboxylase family protein [Deltaproteobacteria bacterium]|nr:acetoacetate decarboxylase family protein [Deltaproteobacteria bacterium]
MGFKKTAEELKGYYSIKTRDFKDAEMLGVMFNSTPEKMQELLPAPLQPTPASSGLIFIAQYQQTNLGKGYREAALFLKCQYKGEEGTYCLSMPIDDETRMHNGRDIFGYPKKMATIHLEKSENEAYACVERNGVRLIEVKARFNSQMPALPPTGPNFLFKAMPKADLTPGFDGPVFLVRQETTIKLKKLELGMASVTLGASEGDPWADVGIANPETLMAFYLTSDNSMLPGKVLAEVDGESYLPHYFKMTDFYSNKNV